MRWGALALIAAILADLAEDLIDPANTSDPDKLFNAAAQHSDRMVISAILLLLTCVAIVPAALWLTRSLTGRGHPTGQFACALAVLGAMGHASLATFYLLVDQMPKGGGDRGEMVALLHRVNDAASFSILAPLVIAFPLAILLSLVAVYRGGIGPRWALAPIIAAPVAALALAPVSQTASTATALILFGVAACAAFLSDNTVPQANLRVAGTVKAFT